MVTGGGRRLRSLPGSAPGPAHIGARYGFEGNACGLCQVGVPCESGIPVADAG